jgi:thiamine kinase-like enzyme
LATQFGPRPGHGDFHSHNVVVDGAGVIDWEWGGLTEPDADLAHLLRWSQFPAHPADEYLKGRVSAPGSANVAPTVWSACPEVATLADLDVRPFTHLVKHDLHQPIAFPVSMQAVERLDAWHVGAAHDALHR